MAERVWYVRLIKRAFAPGVKLAPLARRLPLVSRVVERLLFRDDRVVVVPRRVVRIDRELEPLEHQVLPTQVLEHFIREAGQRWIIDFCICREGNSCQHYPRGLGCIFLGQAAGGIDPRIGRPVTVEQALEHVERCREAGLIHMVGRVKMDTLWLNVGPGARLLTICNCCPCCCITRLLPRIDASIAAKVRRMPGLSVAVTDACQGCGTCLDVCFVEAIELGGDRTPCGEEGVFLGGDRATINDECRGCGRCVSACPQGAIELRIDDPEGAARAIGWIGEVVDVS
jgi:ferredoxin